MQSSTYCVVVRWTVKEQTCTTDYDKDLRWSNVDQHSPVAGNLRL